MICHGGKVHIYVFSSYTEIWKENKWMFFFPELISGDLNFFLSHTRVHKARTHAWKHTICSVLCAVRALCTK